MTSRFGCPTIRRESCRRGRARPRNSSPAPGLRQGGRSGERRRPTQHRHDGLSVVDLHLHRWRDPGRGVVVRQACHLEPGALLIDAWTGIDIARLLASAVPPAAPARALVQLDGLAAIYHRILMLRLRPDEPWNSTERGPIQFGVGVRLIAQMHMPVGPSSAPQAEPRLRRRQSPASGSPRRDSSQVRLEESCVWMC
jgi:hypothetical protein